MFLVVDAVVLVEDQASLQNPVSVVQPDPVQHIIQDTWKLSTKPKAKSDKKEIIQDTSCQ